MKADFGYRKEKRGLLVSFETLEHFANEDGPWHETPEEKQHGFRQSKERAALIRWVRKEMDRRLTPKERRYVELYFFEGKTYRQTAHLTGTNASSVLRGVQRALRKIRWAVQQSGHPIVRRKIRKQA